MNAYLNENKVILPPCFNLKLYTPPNSQISERDSNPESSKLFNKK